jgi:conjugal transfer pilus assembly protein TraF
MQRVKGLTLLILLLTIQLQSVASEKEDSPSSVFFGVTEERVQATPANDALFYKGKERGWFWYEDPALEEIEEDLPPPSKKEPEIKKEPVPKKKPEVKPLSSKWFRENMEKFRDNAVDEPTEENVSTYMYLQRVMLDKAEKFTSVTQSTVMADPVLDENSRRPISNFGAAAMDEKSIKGTEAVAKKLAEVAGLWFFYVSTCEFCMKEAAVLKGLEYAYGFKVIPISLDGLPLPDGVFKEFTIDHGQAKKLGVEVTPSIFLVKPGEHGGAVQIGQGLMAGDEIINKAITLSNQKGWLDKSEFDNTLKVKPLQVDEKTIQNLDEKTMETPGEMVKAIRNNLRKQF